jgi:tRNA 2-thiouridine synthesizing protein A
MAQVVQLRVGALPCPLPIVRLAECAQHLDAGDVVELSGSDPALGPDVEAWCRQLGHRLQSADREVGCWRVRVQLTTRGPQWVEPTRGGEEANSAGPRESEWWHQT